MWPFRRQPAHEVRSSQPYWLLRDGMGDAQASLDGDADCDVAIIGAGITGALVADSLMATGLRIIMLDSNEAAHGSTAASTALLQYEIDSHLTDLVGKIGAEKAARAYLACASSFAMLEARFPELLAQSGYERRESLYLASDERAVPKLQAEHAARRGIKLRTEWLDEAELRRRYGCRRPGAIVSTLAATFDPVRFARGVLAGCRRHGLRVYARSKVEKMEEAGDVLQLLVEGGRRVRARHVVVAAGYETTRFLPRPVIDIDNTFALVTEPLLDPQKLARMPLIWESARPYLYLRTTPDGRLMVGGEDLPFRSPAARDALLPRQVKRLASAYEKLFGEELPRVAFTWAGSFASTPDGLPFVGRAPGADPRVHFALCVGGNGITYSVHAGDLIRAELEGRTHELAGVFGFGRASHGPPDESLEDFRVSRVPTVPAP